MEGQNEKIPLEELQTLNNEIDIYSSLIDQLYYVNLTESDFLRLINVAKKLGDSLRNNFFSECSEHPMITENLLKIINEESKKVKNKRLTNIIVEKQHDLIKKNKTFAQYDTFPSIELFEESESTDLMQAIEAFDTKNNDIKNNPNHFLSFSAKIFNRVID